MNKDLCEYISQVMGVRKDAVQIIAGHKSRRKVLSVRAVSREHATQHLRHEYESGSR